MTIRACLSRFHIRQSLYYRRDSDVMYLHNPKAGCSTVRATMIRDANVDGQFPDLPEEDLPPRVVHGPGPWWSTELQHVTDRTTVFSVVRNPFARALSAYLDKIRRPNHIRRQFLDAHRLPPDAEVSFEEFLERVDLATQIPDQHWLPQTSSLMWTSVPVTRIYFLENLAESADDLSALLGLRTPLVVRQRHSTRASDRLAEHLTPRARQRVLELYADDFDAFGYSHDPADATRAPATFIGGPDWSRQDLHTIHLAGWTGAGPTDEEQPVRLWDTCETYAQRALVMAWPRRLPPSHVRQFVEETHEVLRGSDRNDLFIARRFVCHQPRRFEAGVVRAAAGRLRRSAPYALMAHAAEVRAMIASGDVEGATARLHVLDGLAWEEDRPWRDVTLPELRASLAAAAGR